MTDISDAEATVPEAPVPESQPAELSLADALIASLKSDGAAHSEGVFTLDPQSAREKMRAHQLPDPKRCLLAFVQALVARGAATVQINLDTDDIRFEATGEPFDRSELDTVFSALFSKGTGQRKESLRQLAVGLSTAESLEVRYVTVTAGAEDGAWQLEVRPGKDPVLKPARRAAPGNAIHVKLGLGQQFQRTMARWNRHKRKRDTLASLIRQQCYYARQRIEVNGELTSHGSQLIGVRFKELIKAEHIHGTAGFRVSSPAQARVQLVQNGVWFATVVRKELSRGFAAVVDADHLRKDISQRNVVQDDAFEEVVRLVTEAHDRALLKICEDVAKAQRTPPAKPHWALPMLHKLLAEHRSADHFTSPQAPPLARALGEIPFFHRLLRWEDEADDAVSVLQILQHCADGGAVIYQRPGRSADLHPVPAVLPLYGDLQFLALRLQNEDELSFLERLLASVQP